MGVSNQIVEAEYARLSSQELIQLYKDGGITEEARSVLIKELESRECEIPTEAEIRSHQEEKENYDCADKSSHKSPPIIECHKFAI